MAGRRERQKETRRRRIIAAAGQLFATRGYAASSIGDIARRARLGVGTVYNYFPSKPDIVLAIVRAETGGILSAGETLVERLEESPVEAVAGLLDLYVDLFADFDRELWRELVAAAMTDPSGLGQAFFAQDLRLIGQLDALLQELRGRGDLDHVQIHRLNLFDGVVMVVVGGSGWWFGGGLQPVALPHIIHSFILLG